MSSKPTSPDLPPEPGGITCEEARAAMAAFFASGFKVGADAARQEAMRQHMAACEACSAAYREMGQTAASLKGVAERRAIAEARRRGSHRPSRPRARGMGAMSVFFAWNRKPPSNRVIRTIWRLRPILIVAFFVFLISTLTRPKGPGPRFEVKWTAGRVLVDGKELTSDLPNFGLARGGEVLCEVDSGAIVSRGDTTVELDGGTHLLVEKVFGARLRLFAGSIRIRGPFELGAGSAMLSSGTEAPAELTLALEGDPRSFAVELELVDGELDVATPRLEEHLVAPARLRLDAFGERLPPVAASQ